MSRILAACAGLALCLIAGCSSASAAKASEAVLTYEPQSFREGREFERLERMDDQARVEIERALEVRDRAVGRYVDARQAFDAQELPPEITRPTQEQVSALLAEAQDRWREHLERIAIARDRFETFLRKYPANWYARHRYAWFLADHLLRYEAADEWSKVIELEPRFPYAYNNLGSLYNHMGRDAESLDLYRKAISLKPDDPVFWLNLAVIYSTHRKEAMEKYGWDLPRTFRECINAYRQALRLSPRDTEIAYDLASQFIIAKHFKVTDTADESLDAWMYYLTLDLTDNPRANALRNVGRIYLKEKNDPRTAITWLEQALIFRPGDEGSTALIKQAKDVLSGVKPEPAPE